MIYLIYIFFGVAPSIIWLLFFLRKDAHPESNRMIILVFLLGVAIAPLAAIVECLPVPAGFDLWGKLNCFLPSFWEKFPPFWGMLLSAFLGIAAIEEIAKYLVVKLKVLKSPEFDEPLDVPLYMIIAALGFAAIENFLYLLPPEKPPLAQESLFVSFFPLIGAVFFISFFRFIGATFLHALCSGTIGYFLAKSFFSPKQKTKLLLMGFALAILLHGFFNLSIIKMGESFTEESGKVIITNPQVFYLSLATLITILVGLAIFVTLGFRNLKKIASICKIK